MSKTDARDRIISLPFDGERIFLRWLHVDGGPPQAEWTTRRDEAVRLTSNGAEGAKLILSLFGADVLVEQA